MAMCRVVKAGRAKIRQAETVEGNGQSSATGVGGVGRETNRQRNSVNSSVAER